MMMVRRATNGGLSKGGTSPLGHGLPRCGRGAAGIRGEVAGVPGIHTTGVQPVPPGILGGVAVVGGTQRANDGSPAVHGKRHERRTGHHVARRMTWTLPGTEQTVRSERTEAPFPLRRLLQQIRESRAVHRTTAEASTRYYLRCQRARPPSTMAPSSPSFAVPWNRRRLMTPTMCQAQGMKSQGKIHGFRASVIPGRRARAIRGLGTASV